MKKLRLVILSFSAFSLFCSIFFNLAFIIYDKTHNLNNSLINSIKIPIASNIFVFIVMFVIILLWYLYHRKDRAESITNGLVLLMYLAYATIFVFGLIKNINLYNTLGENELAVDFSMVILLAPGAWYVIGLIPVLFHFIASVSTNGFDNVSEPDNIYGFMYTTIGSCYLLTLILINFTVNNKPLTTMFTLGVNGLVMTITILTFILCAGLRFSSVGLNVFNIVMNNAFLVVWFIIPIYNKYDATLVYLSMYHLIFIIPMFVLSFFILIHYLKIDRFYKGRTKNFLKE